MPRFNLTQANFNNKSNVIEPGMTIFNPKNFTVNTSKGADQIIGTDSVNGDFGFGVLTGAGSQNINSVIASAEFSGRANVAANGIINNGTINTNKGRDLLTGTATANLSATAVTVSQAIAIAETADTVVISNAFADIKLKANADGIDNSGGQINNGKGKDALEGDTEGSVAAVAIATADASAIVEAVAEAPVSDGLTAFAIAFSQSLAEATILARGINNKNGTITTRRGTDTITATATSSGGSLSQTASFALSSASPENQALAQSVADAVAKTKDKAIAIDNRGGDILTGEGKDTITAEASGGESYGIFGGKIKMGDGKDTITAEASGGESYGIFGSDINMGDGADILQVSSFGGGANVKMGNGKDFVEGFGEATINGGDGFDELSFGSYNIADFNISLGANQKVMFELDDITMTTNNFEQFIFNGNYLSYNDLADII